MYWVSGKKEDIRIRHIRGGMIGIAEEDSSDWLHPKHNPQFFCMDTKVQNYISTQSLDRQSVLKRLEKHMII